MGPQGGQGTVLGAGPGWLGLEGRGIVVSRSPKVSVRCIVLSSQKTKEGPGGPPGTGA